MVSLVTSLIVYVQHEPGDELVVALTWFICLVTFILAIVATCKGKDMFDLWKLIVKISWWRVSLIPEL